MIQSLKNDLVIRHLSDGTTKLSNANCWATYNYKGERTDSGIIDEDDHYVPMPEMIAVFHAPRPLKANVKDVLREGIVGRFTHEVIDSDSPISTDHEDLFQKLKECLEENAPQVGSYSLHLKFNPDEESPDDELQEPGDIELATFLAFLSAFGNH